MMKNSGVFIRHTHCPSCPSSDAFAIYDKGDGVRDGTCFSCGHYEVLQKGEEEITTVMKKKERHFSVKDYIKYPKKGIPDRGISDRIASKYGVRVEFSEENGEIIKHYYPYFSKENEINGFKVRIVKDKEFYLVGNKKKMRLFGANLAGDKGKLLIITEGELDALAASEIFYSFGKNFRVVSLPLGANTRGIKDNLEWIENFDNIVLAYDQDERGKKAARDSSEIITHGKCRIMSFSEKDPCDMLKNKKGNEFYASFQKASVHKPEGIITIEDIYKEAIRQPEIGLDWPWETLNRLTYGRRRREMYGFGGGSGSGKTETFKEIIQQVIIKDKLPVGLLFLEENPAITAKSIAGKIVNKRFNIPNGDYTKEDIINSINSIKDEVFFYDHFGQKNWEDIRIKIRYMVISLGIKDIFLDHLTALVADEDNPNNALGRIMADMASLTQELDFTLYYISHLSTPNGTPHEEGGRVTASQFRGSRTIMFWSHFLFGLERNQQSEDQNERNTLIFRVLKDRYTGISTGLTFRLSYDHNSGRLLEVEEDNTGF